MSLIALTGGNGFLGSEILKSLCYLGFDCNLFLRKKVQLPIGVSGFVIPGLDSNTKYAKGLSGVSCVIHCAARVHVINDRSLDPLVEFRKVNVAGTLNLARQSASAGVKRFIFISSIKVNGEGGFSKAPYTADDIPAPVDPYGVSKFEAEQGLQEIATETGMEVVIIRPVLVYGPGVKANFYSMMNWLNKGVPLPLGAINNRRSLVALDNLVDLVITCVDHPAAANQVFLVSDGEDLSTTELLRRMGDSLGKSALLLPVPPCLLKAGATLLGKQALSQRLCGSLQVDISKTRELLGWSPPVSVDDALRKTALHFLGQIKL